MPLTCVYESLSTLNNIVILLLISWAVERISPDLYEMVIVLYYLPPSFRLSFFPPTFFFPSHIPSSIPQSSPRSRPIACRVSQPCLLCHRCHHFSLQPAWALCHHKLQALPYLTYPPQLFLPNQCPNIFDQTFTPTVVRSLYPTHSPALLLSAPPCLSLLPLYLPLCNSRPLWGPIPLSLSLFPVQPSPPLPTPLFLPPSSPLLRQRLWQLWVLLEILPPPRQAPILYLSLTLLSACRRQALPCPAHCRRHRNNISSHTNTQRNRPYRIMEPYHSRCHRLLILLHLCPLSLLSLIAKFPRPPPQLLPIAPLLPLLFHRPLFLQHSYHRRPPWDKLHPSFLPLRSPQRCLVPRRALKPFRQRSRSILLPWRPSYPGHASAVYMPPVWSHHLSHRPHMRSSRRWRKACHPQSPPPCPPPLAAPTLARHPQPACTTNHPWVLRVRYIAPPQRLWQETM